MSGVEELQYNPKISIIIPFYNTQDFIQTCIESVLKQTYQNFEIICIDDGSEDQSLTILQHLMLNESRIRLIQIENHGQGYARNLAMHEAEGEYILFLDSDDWIEPLTLELALKRAISDCSDFVIFDWRYYYTLGNRNVYNNIDLFYGKDKLEGAECLEILRIEPIFIWHMLYNKKFLDENDICFLEGYIYEDAPFLIRAICNAKKISLIHSPLYRATVSTSSSTKSNYNTDWHSQSFIASTHNVIEYINSIHMNDPRIYYWYRLLLEKFVTYYTQRTPHIYRKKFAKEFIKCFANIDYLPDLQEGRFFSICHRNIWSQNRILLFRFLIVGRVKYQSLVKKVYIKCKKIKAYLSSKSKKIKKVLFPFKSKQYIRKSYATYAKQPLYEDVVLFMGFDYRYTGNSRYLFEDLTTKNLHGKKLFFVTDDPLVPLQYRIKPNSERCDRFVARSKIVIFESWIPAKYAKRAGAIWIQLWHGTPLKRLLYDSNEKYIFERNRNNKNIKFNDIQRWDYLIADNPNVSSLFESCFLFPKNRIISCGYPRVKYLLEHVCDNNYKELLKDCLGISRNKKIVLYVPTWRDYNYKKHIEEYDLSYLLNLQQLQNTLGSTYEIIYKDHPFVSAPQNVDFKNYCDCETQELLLVADYLITDYSSVLFDALAIDLPIILYCRDFNHNGEARGVYNALWDKLKKYNTESVDGIKNMIEKYKIDAEYLQLKEKYSYDASDDSSLYKIILN